MKEPEAGSSFHLLSQNKTLSIEMLRNKRTIAEGRRELELMRRKSREMEALVSLIQRAWSQVSFFFKKSFCFIFYFFSDGIWLKKNS
jgi:hypothetical protein